MSSDLNEDTLGEATSDRPLSDYERRMIRRTRICIYIIVIGLINFLAYTIGYMFLGGDAMNGYVRQVVAPDKVHHLHYFLVAKGMAYEVNRSIWVYSAVHSISIWVTVGAVLMAMLTLAKDRIVSSMRTSIVRGRTLITIVATVVTLMSLSITAWFLIYMIQQLTLPARMAAP
jgi:hypothetical protein